MKLQLNTRGRAEAGYIALVITLFMVGISVLILGATLTRSTSNARLNDRNSLYISANGAAEAAVEKVIAHMMVDFSVGQEPYVFGNLNYYQTSLLPTSAENPYWDNFAWSDGQGNGNRIYVAKTSSNPAGQGPFVQLANQYSGLSGFSSSYRIIANVSMKNTTYNYNFTNAVQQDVQLATIPIFQYAIFYNGLLEFSDCAPLVVNGPVHCNSNIYVGTISSSSLTFNSMVGATGTITNPPNCGLSQSQWQGPIKYNGKPTPGYLTGVPSLTLPIGTNSTIGANVQQILYPPAPGEDVLSPMGMQRYYNKAQMVIWITPSNTFTIILKASASDLNPIVLTNTLAYLATNNSPSNYFPFLTTTNKMFDTRENKTMLLTQIDVGKLTNWMNTNIYVYNANNSPYSSSNKFSLPGSPVNIIYVADWRTTNSLTNVAVRMTNGAVLPSVGLTIATPNPLYIQGFYNCPSSSYQGSTNVSGLPGASFACDALTVLSPNWKDSASWNNKGGSGIPNAANDTVNAAVITGNVPSTGPGTYQNSGGVHNLPRLLESWGSSTLTLNTSMVCLFSSTWATGLFIPPGQSTSYYTAPNRNFNFNLNYTSASGIPPGTPNICALIRSSWCNPPPNTIGYTNYLLNNFVAR